MDDLFFRGANGKWVPSWNWIKSGVLFALATCEFTNSTLGTIFAIEKVTPCSMLDALRSMLYICSMLYDATWCSMLNARFTSWMLDAWCSMLYTCYARCRSSLDARCKEMQKKSIKEEEKTQKIKKTEEEKNKEK